MYIQNLLYSWCLVLAQWVVGKINRAWLDHGEILVNFEFDFHYQKQTSSGEQRKTQQLHPALLSRSALSFHICSRINRHWPIRFTVSCVRVAVVNCLCSVTLPYTLLVCMVERG